MVTRALIKVDLHLHSAASFDCQVPTELVAQRCKRLGLRPVFLTDHNTVSAALALQNKLGTEVVVGEEVMTSEGELIGLFLRERVEPGRTAADTAKAIRAQGGLVYLEHPYDRNRRHLSEEAIEKVGEMIDIVEVWNGRSDTGPNRRALDLCEVLDAAPGAGSDAHTVAEIGRVLVEMEDFGGAEDFLTKLRAGRIRRRQSRVPFFGI